MNICTKSPRWASVNLGIFICMQCSGIHRSLEVHISKVISTTLYTWLPDQIAFIQSMGNEKSNSYWEAELPPKYDRVGTEKFIRAKYVEKRWVPKNGKTKPSLVVREEGFSVHKLGPGTRINTVSRIKNLPEEPNKPQLSDSSKSVTASEKFLNPVLPTFSKEVTPVQRPLEARHKAEPAALSNELEKSGVNAMQFASVSKVDYATNLFNMLYMESSEQMDVKVTTGVLTTHSQNVRKYPMLLTIHSQNI